MALRPYQAHDFTALYKLDQACFPAGIAYSKLMLRYFLHLPTADCLVAEESKKITAFILAEENPPLAHIITLDVAEAQRRKGVGSTLLAEMEQHFAFRGVRSVLLETATNNEAGIAFWQRHGYRTEAILQRYYLGRIDAFEMRKLLPGKSASAAAQKET